MVSVYAHEHVRGVERLHADLLRLYPRDMSVLDVLSSQAETLFAEHGRGNSQVCTQISNWYPPGIGCSFDEIMATSFSLDDARLTVSREHGFPSWDVVVRQGNTALDESFEEAIDCVVNGRLIRLQELLSDHPELANQRSVYGHRASLLHYVAANGVETWRQKVASNAPSIAQLLIENGADVDATAPMYGGHYDTLALLLSSEHPAKAGLTDAIASVLRGRPGSS